MPEMLFQGSRGLRNEAGDVTRTTSRGWNDATMTLLWAVQEKFSAGENLYTSVKPARFTRGAAGPQRAATRPLTLAGGSVTFK